MLQISDTDIVTCKRDHFTIKLPTANALKVMTEQHNINDNTNTELHLSVIIIILCN